MPPHDGECTPMIYKLPVMILLRPMLLILFTIGVLANAERGGWALENGPAASLPSPSPAFSTVPTHQPLVKLTGTFLQYQSWMMQLDSVKWAAELDAMKATGVDTIVIQWLKADTTRFYPVNTPGNDPTEIILKYADQHQMKIFLGLHFERSWWTKWDDEDYLHQVAKKNVEMGHKLFARYGRHASLAGWYIPYEMSDSDFDAEEVQNFRGFFGSISAGLRKLSPKKKYPVAISTFFEGKIPATAVEKIYTEIFRGSGIDIVMVQDGVGAHDWSVTQMNQKVGPYLNAFQSAAAKNKIRVWGIVENFNTQKESGPGEANRTATDIGRFKEQLAIQAAHPTEKVLTFDFFHYMSPQRGEAQKLLYDNYLQQVKTLP
jgi:hypothetical protein